MESKKNYHAAYDEDFKKSIVTLYSKRPHGTIGNLTPNAMEQA